MKRDQVVVPLHPQPAERPAPEPGGFGLRWTAEHQGDTRRWDAVGRDHGRLVAAVEVRSAPGKIRPQELAWLTAQLLNDVGEDAANLLLATHFAPEET